MKKVTNYVMALLCVGSLAFSAGAFMKVNAAPSTTSAPAGQPVDLTYAAEKALPAVVHIKYVQNSKTTTVDVQDDPFGGFFDPFGFFGNPGNGGTRKQRVQTPKKEATGSGVIISSDGYIVTNNHVVEGADELTVTLNDNREYSARIVGTDKTTDLALIKVDGKNLPTLPIADSDKVRVGEWVIAVGNPFGLNNTVTAGIISAKARTLGANGVESFIQTDAAINSGNSGGALVNERGELVGINAMIYSQTGSYSGYGFAIPTTIMNKVVADLKAYGVVQRAVLGVQGTDVGNYIDMEKAKGNEVDLGTVSGVYIDQVTDGSAAQEAGLQKGDVIVKLAGKDTDKMSRLQEEIAQHRPGDKVSVTYLRNKKTQKTDVTLRNAQGGTKVMEEVDMDDMGVQLKPLADKDKQLLRIPYGLVVNNIRRGKLQEAGVDKGTIFIQVNDAKLNTVEDWEEAVKRASQSTDRTLWIKALTPSGRKVSFVIDLNE